MKSPRRPILAGRAAIWTGLLLASLPLAAVTTVLLFPLWAWVEATFAIEAVGHSGPADWCYAGAYLTWALGLGWLVRRRLGRRSADRAG